MAITESGLNQSSMVTLVALSVLLVICIYVVFFRCCNDQLYTPKDCVVGILCDISGKFEATLLCKMSL